MATNTTGLAPSRLFFVTDRTSGLRFLVDTGAEVSVLPVAQLSRASLSAGPPLQAVNNSNIATFGTVSRTLNLGLRRTFRWVFLLADIKHPILGADFLSHFNLMVDLTRGCLVDSLTHLQINGVLTEGSPPAPVCPVQLLVTPFALFFRSSLLSPHLSPRMPRCSMMSPTTLPPPAPQFMPAHADSRQNASRPRSKSLSTCSTWASSALLRARGPHPSTWSQRKPPATGARVGTTEP